VENNALRNKVTLHTKNKISGSGGSSRLVVVEVVVVVVVVVVIVAVAWKRFSEENIQLDIKFQ